MFGWNRNGWIGVDIGESAIKVAQLRRVGDALHLSAAGVSQRDRQASPSLTDDLRAASALAQHLRGSHVAATLSMSACQVETTNEETPLPADRCGDQWSAGPDSSYTLSTPADSIDSAVKGIARVGLQCEVIDGPPLAMARVLQLTPGYRPDELLMAFDWGETAATVVAAKGGLAQYARRLNGGGFGDVRQRTAEALGLSESDTERLLARVDSTEPSLPPTERRLFKEALRNAMTPVVQEIKRSLEHLGGKLRTKPPGRCFVMGAGGAVPELPTTLGEAIGVPSQPWTATALSRDDSLASTPDCLLAQAIALSALAWEATH